jgi:ribosomal protein L11 methyltransferase
MGRPNDFLWQVTAAVNHDAEHDVSALMEGLYGVTPTVYTPHESQASVISAYVSSKTTGLLERRKALNRELRRLRASGLSIGNGRVRVRKVRQENWAESWKRHFKPIEVGKALLIKPSWSQKKAKMGQVTLVLDPGLSFGTGHHPTTAFCLHQIVKCLASRPQCSFLDIGTGTGILAIAAAKLGFAPVTAFDNDAVAIRVARENARENGLSQGIEFSCLDLGRLPLARGPRYDLICANLEYDGLLAHRMRIIKRLKPNGILVLAGILNSQFDAVERAYLRAGLQLASSRIEGDWRSGVFGFQSPKVVA